jgi:uncharacterized membrane protein YeaQ/YmgE (transglycosylase-associated protein family)
LRGNVLARSTDESKLKSFSPQITQIFTDHELIRKLGNQKTSVAEKSGQWQKPGHTRQTFCREKTEEIMLHLIWYIIVGLIAGIIAKSVLHVHMTIFWTIVLGIIGSIIGGAVTHLFSPPSGRFHPAGIIFSTLGAILVLYLCLKLHIRFPRVL